MTDDVLSKPQETPISNATEQTYLALLLLPHNALRAKLQAELAACRDAIALIEDCDPEDAQNRWEGRAERLLARLKSPAESAWQPLIQQLAWYYDVNDCKDRHEADALEVPLRDLRLAYELAEQSGIPIRPTSTPSEQPRATSADGSGTSLVGCEGRKPGVHSQPTTPAANETTCYIERSKVREILFEHNGEPNIIGMLRDVDALPISTAGDFRSQPETASVSDLGGAIYEAEYPGERTAHQDIMRECETLARTLLSKFNITRKA